MRLRFCLQPVSKSKAPAASAAPRKSSVESEYNGRPERGGSLNSMQTTVATPAAALAKPATRKAPSEMTDAEMKEEIKRMMAGKRPPAATTISPASSSSSSLAAPASAAATSSSRSPPTKPTPSPAVAPISPSLTPSPPPPSKPPSTKPSPTPIPPHKPVPPTPTRPPAHPTPSAAVEGEEEDDYYDEDFDEDAVAIDEDPLPSLPSEPIPPLPSLPSPISRSKRPGLPSPSTDILPPTPRLGTLVQAVQAQINRENAALIPSDPTLRTPRLPSSPHLPSPRPLEREGGLSPSPSTSPRPSPHPPLSPPRRMGLPSAHTVLLGKTRQADEARRLRVRAVLERVELVVEGFDMGGWGGWGEWDGYMREVGRGVRQNVASQYNEEWREEEVQTEEVRTAEVDTQAPEDRYIRFAAVRGGEGGGEGGGKREGGGGIEGRLDWLQSAAKVMESLVTANVSSAAPAVRGSIASHFPGLLAAPSSLASLTLGHYPLVLPAALGSRRISCTAFAPPQLGLLLVGYGKPPVEEGGEVGLHHRGVVGVWEVGGVGRVQQWLYCDGDVTAVAMDNNGWAVVAGTAEGSLALWDLREHPTLHRASPFGGPPLRHASYSTDGHFAIKGEAGNHRAAVTRIRFLPQGGKGGGGVGDMGGSLGVLTAMGGSGFEVLTMDAEGTVMTWRCVEVRDASLAGSEVDLGLAIGSRVKLHRTDCAEQAVVCEGFDAEPLPDDADEYVLALSGGRVQRVRRFGPQPSPSSYLPLPRIARAEAGTTDGEGDVEGVDDATCIAFHPVFPSFFLAGYGSGLVALYSVESSVAVQLWFPSSSSPIVALHWSPSSASTFVAASRAGELRVFALLKDPNAPSFTAKLDRVLRVEVSQGDKEGKSSSSAWLLTVQSAAEGESAHLLPLHPTLSAEVPEDEVAHFSAYLARAR